MLRSLGLGGLLLLVAFFGSAHQTNEWNGQRCIAGTENGYPLPFVYSDNRATTSTSLATPSCRSGLSAPSDVNLPNALLDYVFWFAVSLPIVIFSSWIFSLRGAAREEEAAVTEAESNIH